MSKRDKQRMFNRVWKGIHEQGGPATNDEAGGCVYHSPEGRKCAAGLLFTKAEHEAIADKMEETATFERLIGAGIITRPVLVRNADFVTDLQHIHDSAAHNAHDFMPAFERHMRRLAHEHGLEVPE